MKKISWRAMVAVMTAILFVLVSAFVIWASLVSPATDVALQAMNSDSQVYVSPENSWVVFFPAANPHPETGFIFYPGAKVDYRAYAPVLKMIAAKGYFVVLVPVPLNLALFDVNAGAYIQATYPEVRNWFVGGHSLGGVAAVSFATGREELSGLVLWAAPPANDRLIHQEMPVLLVYGTRDWQAEELASSVDTLPADAKVVVIEGGNHAQFGSYGPQAGDNEATISPEEQWSQAADATVEFFAEVLK